MFTSSLFFISRTHTEFFNRTEYILYILIIIGRCILMFTYAERWVLSYSIIVWRINKIHEILWKLRFRRETIAFSRAFHSFYMSRGPRPSRTVAFFWITNKTLKVGTCHFTIIERKITVIFREHFSSLRFDSGKIFKIIISCCTPRTTYTIFYFELCMYYACTICMN